MLNKVELNITIYQYYKHISEYISRHITKHIMESILELLDADNNKFKINCIKRDTCITTHIKTNKQLWENWLEKYIEHSYVPNTNIIDIGAHIGTFSLMSSKYISDNSHIYSFEPIYSKILTMNINENNLTDKVKVFPIGLSNKQEKLESGFIDFSASVNYGYTRIDTLKEADKESKYIINVEKLDDLNIDNISFMKIDVEGNERKVLEGAYNTIVKNTPTILIEIWCTSKNAIKKNSKHNDGIKNEINCFEFLFNLGYICIPVSPQSDDFLFIHYKKKELLKNLIGIL